MKMTWLFMLMVTLVAGIEVPQQPQGLVAYHDFLDTPFLDDQFGSLPISGSANISFKQINEKNVEVRSALQKLVHEPFFRIFKLNLFKQCPFWQQEGFCLYRSCAVDTINDWADLPEIWQPEELGKIQGTEAVENQKSVDGPLGGDECIDEINDHNYCDLDGADEDCVYVDLVENPERFTGYGGEQSFQIWKLIYEENCFFNHNNDLLGKDDQCIEQQIFYRLISGLHSSISTHLTNEYLDVKTKEYGPNLLQFMFKVGNFPDRIENMYLNYVLVVKSLIKLYQSQYLEKVSLCPLKFEDKERELKQELKELVQPFLSLANGENDAFLFNENDLFQDANAADLKNEFKMRFRNVSSIMDCVHCDRCRVWGKVQTTGYGTALKVLFELNDENKDFSLEKVELIALINTFDRLSKSILSVNNFQRLFLEKYQEEEVGGDLSAENSSTDDDIKSDFRIGIGSGKPKKKRLEDFAFPDIEDKNEKKGELTQTLREAFYTELNNVGEALNFVWNSYFSLPKTVFDYTSVKLSLYWNKFIGMETPSEADAHYQTLFDKSTSN